MIGIVIFFLVAVHLALGMLMSLLPISQRLLGERFFRFNAAISLVLLAVAELVYGSAEKTRLSHEKALYWKAQIDGANPWLWGCGTLVALYLLSLPYRKRRVSRILLIGADPADPRGEVDHDGRLCVAVEALDRVHLHQVVFAGTRRDDRPAAKLAKSGGAVVAVGRPVEPLLGPDRDDRIEEAVEPTDHV